LINWAKAHNRMMPIELLQLKQEATHELPIASVSGKIEV
jgi:hypothetical protein